MGRTVKYWSGKKCLVCGEDFRTSRAHAFLCSDACRQTWSRFCRDDRVGAAGLEHVKNAAYYGRRLNCCCFGCQRLKVAGMPQWIARLMRRVL